MTVYVAGPMTGYPEHNYPAFERATTRLRAAGHTVVSPHELHGDDLAREWEHYLRADLARLVECDAIYLLPGWELSRGATLEAHVARCLGMKQVRL